MTWKIYRGNCKDVYLWCHIEVVASQFVTDFLVDMTIKALEVICSYIARSLSTRDKRRSLLSKVAQTVHFAILRWIQEQFDPLDPVRVALRFISPLIRNSFSINDAVILVGDLGRYFLKSTIPCYS